MNEVQVVNRNAFALKGRFAATDYVFESGVPVAIPQAAAEHIFGWNDKDKTGALNRLQLLLPGNGSTYETAMKALRNVSFHSGRVVFEGGKPGQPKRPQTQEPAEPGGEPERAPGVPGHQQPGPQPGTQHPGTPKKGPGEHEQFEDDDEEKQGGKQKDLGIGGRPGAATDPGRKSEAGENPTPSSASGDLDDYLAMLASVHPRAKRKRR